MKSSPLLGIVSLVDGDHDAGVTSLRVTDTKYIRATDSLDVYRGNVLIETLTVSAKTETSITVGGTTNPLLSSDEVWVAGSFAGARQFRWADLPASGISVKQYDTFSVCGGTNERIKMFTNIGDVMWIANNNNIAVWDNYSLKTLDLNIGCVSDKGFVKLAGTMAFIGYDGIYVTTGGLPKLVSSKIEPLFKAATKNNKEASAAGKKGFSVFFTLGDVALTRSDGSAYKTLEDVVVEYNMRQDNCFIHTGIPTDMFDTWLKSTDSDASVFANTSDFNIYEFLTGESDDTNDADIEIPFRIDSNWIQLCEPEKRVYPYKLVAVIDRGNAIQSFVALDNEDTSDTFYEIRPEEGGLSKGVAVMNFTNRNPLLKDPPSCWRLKLSIRDTGKKMCKISRLKILFVDTLEEFEQLK